MSRETVPVPLALSLRGRGLLSSMDQVPATASFLATLNSGALTMRLMPLVTPMRDDAVFGR